MALEGHPVVFWTERKLVIHTEGTTIAILKNDGCSNIRTAFRHAKNVQGDKGVSSQLGKLSLTFYSIIFKFFRLYIRAMRLEYI